MPYEYQMVCWLTVVLVLIGIGAGLARNADQDQSVALFDGMTLDGWSVHSGFAKYRVEGNEIVGTTAKGSPNSFLCTDRQYGDFVLEFEVKVDPRLNSGVQIRSQIAPAEMAFVFPGRDGKPQSLVIPADRVYGYQVEIATEKAGSSGSVYDEARRAVMLASTTSDPPQARPSRMASGTSTASSARATGSGRGSTTSPASTCGTA